MFYSRFLALGSEKIPDDWDRNYVLTNRMDTRAVQELATTSQSKVFRPQELISDNEDYYIARDMQTKTLYICYRNLLMVDIDTPEPSTVVELAKNYAKRNKVRLRLYRSRNGVHIFDIGKKNDYRDERSISFMLEMGSDFFYVVYSYIRGWSVRLNPKEGERLGEIYSYMLDIGTAEVDEGLEKLCTLHEELARDLEELL